MLTLLKTNKDKTTQILPCFLQGKTTQVRNCILKNYLMLVAPADTKFQSPIRDILLYKTMYFECTLPQIKLEDLSD